MISKTTASFRKRWRELPPDIRAHSRKVYQRWQENPWHPSLRFKRIHHSQPVCSVRIGIHWRAVCVLEKNTAIWFWIGSHKDYDALIKNIRRTRN